MKEGGERGQGNFDELSNILILAFRFQKAFPQMENLCLKLPFNLQSQMLRLKGQRRQDILAKDRHMMPFHVEKFDGKGIQRRQDIILVIKRGWLHSAFSSGYQTKGLWRDRRSPFGKDEQEINIRFAGHVISRAPLP